MKLIKNSFNGFLLSCLLISTIAYGQLEQASKKPYCLFRLLNCGINLDNGTLHLEKYGRLIFDKNTIYEITDTNVYAYKLPKIENKQYYIEWVFPNKHVYTSHRFIQDTLGVVISLKKFQIPKKYLLSTELETIILPPLEGIKIIEDSIIERLKVNIKIFKYNHPSNSKRFSHDLNIFIAKLKKYFGYSTRVNSFLRKQIYLLKLILLKSKSKANDNKILDSVRALLDAAGLPYTDRNIKRARKILDEIIKRK